MPKKTTLASLARKAPDVAKFREAFLENQKLPDCPHCRMKMGRVEEGNYVICVGCKRKITMKPGICCENCGQELALVWRSKQIGPIVYGPGNHTRNWQEVVHKENNREACPGTYAKEPEASK